MYNTGHDIVAQHCNFIWNTVYIMKWYILVWTELLLLFWFPLNVILTKRYNYCRRTIRVRENDDSALCWLRLLC